MITINGILLGMAILDIVSSFDTHRTLTLILGLILLLTVSTTEFFESVAKYNICI